MPTHDLTLYHAPGACSSVTAFALERTGQPYDVELIALGKGQQQTAEYLAKHPLGKVPLLLIDGVAMIENIAILNWIAETWPEAGLYPAGASLRQRAEVLGGMAFSSGTLHPLVRGMLNPQRVTTGDLDGVREMSRMLLTKSLKFADKRIGEHGWWAGDMSIADVYLNWALSVARAAGFDMGPFPALAALPERLTQDSAFARMLAKDADYKASME